MVANPSIIYFRVAQEHPALVQAASHIAADITKDIPSTSRLRRTSNSEDDALMDIEPEVEEETVKFEFSYDAIF